MNEVFSVSLVSSLKMTNVSRTISVLIIRAIVTTSSFILFIPKDLKKKSRFLSRLLLYVQVPNVLTCKPYRKI
jgi:hypothetical protein